MEIRQLTNVDGVYDYQSDITVDEWKSLLLDTNVVQPQYLENLLKFYNEPDHKSTCKALSVKYNKPPLSFNSGIVHLAKAIQKKLNRFGLKGTDGKSTYWPILMVGKQLKKGLFEWRIREELVEAIQELNLHNTNNMSETKNTPSQQPLNQILYGPPGTGKTYNTIKMAVDIIEGKDNNRSYADSKTRYEELRNEGRIKFVTFHQNYSYEDFVEGLRPITNDASALQFENRDGVFKELCRKANANQSTINKLSFQDAFEGLLSGILDGSLNVFKIPMIRVSYWITDIDDTSIGFTKTSGGTAHRLTISRLNSMYDAEEYITKAGGLKGYYNGLLEKLLEYGKENAIALDNDDANINSNNFVLIIDEINRANISRVFGELITLIEPDKRAGNEHAMSVTLPSGDTFLVPNNLFIIGTMNTADKSIALLDIALRRRFEFIPMYPRYEIDGTTIHRAEFLETLNKEICKSDSLNRDLQIGHSYFMGDDFDFYKTLRNKVVPLLLEYTMNDEAEVNRLLTSSLPSKLAARSESLMPWEEVSDNIAEEFNNYSSNLSTDVDLLPEIEE